MKIFETADECLQYCGMMNIENGKGVTIPSQIRYVEYFEKILKNNMEHNIIFVKNVLKILEYYFIIDNKGISYKSGKKKDIIEGEDFDVAMDFDIDKGFIVEGDAYVVFLGFILLGKRKKFLNFDLILISYLIIVIFMISKKEIDKACKDKNSKEKKNYKIN